jgi:hypothetical protein
MLKPAILLILFQQRNELGQKILILVRVVFLENNGPTGHHQTLHTTHQSSMNAEEFHALLNAT